MQWRLVHSQCHASATSARPPDNAVPSKGSRSLSLPADPEAWTRDLFFISVDLPVLDVSRKRSPGVRPLPPGVPPPPRGHFARPLACVGAPCFARLDDGASRGHTTARVSAHCPRVRVPFAPFGRRDRRCSERVPAGTRVRPVFSSLRCSPGRGPNGGV